MQSAYKKKKGSPFHPTLGDRIFDTFNAIFMILLCIVTLYPMYFVIVASFTKNSYLVAHPGAVFCRDSRGRAFQCDAQLGEMGVRYGSAVIDVSIAATAVDLTDEFRAGGEG